jgi:PTH2 family peptidyl-tRNA hydrolase
MDHTEEGDKTVHNGVNLEMLAVLMSLGFEENICKRGLIATGNRAADEAISWVLEHADDPVHHEPVTAAFSDSMSASLKAQDLIYDHAFQQLAEVPTVYHKMVLVVRKDLNMSVGKVAAQCSHAAIGIYKRLYSGNPKLLNEWEHEGQKKVVVSCNSEAELNELEKKAISISLPCQIIKDAGRTEIAPGSKTVLAVLGPDYIVDQVTGGLSLLH